MPAVTATELRELGQQERVASDRGVARRAELRATVAVIRSLSAAATPSGVNGAGRRTSASGSTESCCTSRDPGPCYRMHEDESAGSQ